ncbi:hypothetical protein [Ferribacterium limneticum]|uniref:hypothetical protein n=1 Tax=Ferribacterium limneticum TaxID=76259 RepID=UPI001CF8AEC2|nr:hypothetical protein [Ferribacterium limneticum]UCV21081.1 hypothetical protein KI613_10965 [Ferribacterium limneticum]
MQTDPHWQEQTLARFILASRQHLGLIQAPTSLRPPRRVAGSSRKLLRSLVVASSLGALFGAPALASETSNEPAKRSPNEHGTRMKANDHSAHAHRLSIHGRNR